MPPAPDRTDIYDKLGRFLKLPAGTLAGLADLQRKNELRKKIQSPPAPLFREVRELFLAKCKRDKRRQVRAIFEKEPFGELERLITQKLLDVVKALPGRNWDQTGFIEETKKHFLGIDFRDVAFNIRSHL